MSRKLLVLIFSHLLMVCPPVVNAGDAFEEVFGPVQTATQDDLEIKAPFIGSFRGSTRQFDDGETEYHFVLNYDWWDAEKNFVKFTVSMVIPSQDRTLLRSEGFYGFDRFSERLYVFGVFSGGMTGEGFIGQFDEQAGTHEIWARSVDQEGVVTWVRDRFEIIDADHWRNQTLMRRGDEPEFQEVHQDTYTRL